MEWNYFLSTPKPRFSKPLFSKYFNLVNKLQLPSYIFYYIHHLDLVNKRGLTGLFTKSRFGCIMRKTSQMMNSGHHVWTVDLSDNQNSVDYVQ